MTTSLSSNPVLTGNPALASPRRPNLVRAEFLKARTTNVWWIFGLSALVTLGLALLVNATGAYFSVETLLNATDDQGNRVAPDPAAVDALLVTHAANVFTSGQFFGLLAVMLFSAIMMTNEFHHQTVTTTFLATPQRGRVLLAKAATGVIIGGSWWAVTTVISLVVGIVLFTGWDYDTHLGDWAVQRSILMNLLAYVVWALLGLGLGAVMRNQIGASLTGAGVYIIGGQIIQGIFLLLAFVTKKPWVFDLQVLAPSVAAAAMVTPDRTAIPFDENTTLHTPYWWAGLLVLVGYSAVLGGLGWLALRRRDIS